MMKNDLKEVIFDRLKQEIFQIYQDYERNYAYGFCAGMIYAMLICERIDEDQSSDLNRLNRDTFNKGLGDYNASES